MRPFYPNLSQVAKGLTARRKMSRNIDNISPIYRVLEASNTTFRGDMSEDRFFANNCQKIGNISVISDKSVIFRKNHLERQLIANFFTKNRPSLQRDLTAQITPVLIRRPNLNLNGNKEIQWPDCSQIVIQRPKLNFNGNLRFQRLFWPKFRL